MSRDTTAASAARQLLILFVAYHPEHHEVERLKHCLDVLPPEIGYAVVANDYVPGEAVDALADNAVCFLTSRDNLGYGRAVNRLVNEVGELPPFLAVMNTDLFWRAGTFESILSWMAQHHDVQLAVPKIIDEYGVVQKLCKRNPTVLAMLSRRFVPFSLKPKWLKRYDHWYCMGDKDYNSVFDSSYLSGCCMVVRSHAFRLIGGFDESYFLYLEDADLTRMLARYGRCVHFPWAEVVHCWGRGNYKSLGLALVNIQSAWIYFKKWGLCLW